MESLRLVLLFLHLIGMAALFGCWFAQVSGPIRRVVPGMIHGALTQLVTGVLLVFVRGDAPDVDQAKVGIKGVVLLAILWLLWTNRSKAALAQAGYLAIGLLTLLNVGIAVFWT